MPTHTHSTITFLSVKAMFQNAIRGKFVEFIICTFLQISPVNETSRFPNSHHPWTPFSQCWPLPCSLRGPGSARDCTPQTHRTSRGSGQLAQGSWSTGHAVAAWKCVPKATFFPPSASCSGPFLMPRPKVRIEGAALREACP